MAPLPDDRSPDPDAASSPPVGSPPPSRFPGLPDLEDAVRVHDRRYDVEVLRDRDGRLRVRGAVRDQKPAGMLIPDDPDPLTVLHMAVELVIDFPALTIVDVTVVMSTTPHGTCTDIEDDYQKLVGLSIARGFSRSVKDLLGGPRGCTHVGALLQAMAPAVIQSTWSMRTLAQREAGLTMEEARANSDPRDSLKFNLNTCHVWDEGGDMVAGVLSGRAFEVPLWAERRLTELGRDPAEFGRN